MYVTSINFHRALEWFSRSEYKYMLLYASGSSKFDYEMIEEFMKYKSLIDRQTGSLMCFLHFIERSEMPSYDRSVILKANHIRAVEDFMLFHISSEEVRELSRKNLYTGVGLEATFETTDELCDFFGISRYRLPAFILIHKPLGLVSIKDLRNSFAVYPIKRKEDFASLLLPVKVVNDMTTDLKAINLQVMSVEREPIYKDLLMQIKSIHKGIHSLKGKSKEDLMSEAKLRLSEINELIKKEYGIHDCEIQLENPEKIKRQLLKLYLLEDFMAKYSDKYYRYKSSFYKAKKWDDKGEEYIARLQKDLDIKRALLENSKSRDSRLEILLSERQKIIETYKRTFEESLMIEDATELINAIFNDNTLPAILDTSIRDYMDIKSITDSIVSEIKEKVRQKQYNVFISCKSEDYKLGEKVSDFLKDNGYEPFIASKSLRAIAEDKYSPVISEVIDICKHMIVFASNRLYVETPYVRSEWEMFCNEVKAGRKNGKLLTIIEDPKLGSLLPIDLRCREVLSIDGYKKDICRYLSK